MSQKKDRKRIRRKETNDSEVCTEWVQKWTSPNRIRRNKDLYVREIISGPFYSPKLITTQPIVKISSRKRQAINVNENCNNLRHGIPDTWKEYLTRKGFCNSMEARVLRKNLIPFYVRSFATDRIWNELGLPLVQGIPDPWKSKFLPERRSVKSLRQRCVYNDSTSTQIASVYDGDDEAEIEHCVKSQFNKDHVDNKKDPLQEENKVEKTLQASTNNLDEAKNNEREHGDQPQVDKNPKLTSKRRKPIRKFRNDVQKETKKIISNAPAISTNTIKKTPTTRNKVIQIKEKLDSEKPSKQKYKTEKDDTKNRFEKNLQKCPNIVCCNYALQNHVPMNVKNVSEQGSSIQGIDVSNLVLCQNCENIYHNGHLQQMNYTMKTMDVYVPDTRNALQHKIIDKTKTNISCLCLEKAKERLKEENHIASEQGLKLVCGRCNNPYLKIAAIFTDTTGQRTSFYNRTKKERNKIRTRVLKCPMTRKQSINTIRCSENCCCTCTETKTHASRDLDRTRRRNSYDNNATEKDVPGLKFENVKVETEDDIGPEDIIEIHEEKIIPKTVITDGEEVLKDVCYDDENKKGRESKYKSDTEIVDEKPRVKQFQQVRFDPALKYAVSDSGCRKGILMLSNRL